MTPRIAGNTRRTGPRGRVGTVNNGVGKKRAVSLNRAHMLNALLVTNFSAESARDLRTAAREVLAHAKRPSKSIFFSFLAKFEIAESFQLLYYRLKINYIELMINNWNS